MSFLTAIVRFMLYVIILPVKIITLFQYLNALFFYKKQTLTLERPWKIGHHVVNNKNEKKCIVLWRSRIKRSPCPDWYKTYVAIKPCK